MCHSFFYVYDLCKGVEVFLLTNRWNIEIRRGCYLSPLSLFPFSSVFYVSLCLFNVLLHSWSCSFNDLNKLCSSPMSVPAVLPHQLPGHCQPHIALKQPEEKSISPVLLMGQNTSFCPFTYSASSSLVKLIACGLGRVANAAFSPIQPPPPLVMASWQDRTGHCCSETAQHPTVRIKTHK